MLCLEIAQNPTTIKSDIKLFIYISINEYEIYIYTNIMVYSIYEYNGDHATIMLLY